MIAFREHFRFQFMSGIRNPTSMLMNYLFPLGFFGLMGLVMTQINPDFEGLVIPSMVIVTLLASTVLGLPGDLVEAREAGVYRSFKIIGVPAGSIMGVPLLSTLIHAFVASAVIASTAGPLFDAVEPDSWWRFWAITALAAFAFGSLAALIGVVSTGARGTVLWSQLVFLPAMLIGGLMMDLELIPEGVRSFSALLPPAHAMQAYLGAAYGVDTPFDPVVSVVVLAVGGIVAFALSRWLFSWDGGRSGRSHHPAWALLAVVPYVVAAILM
jgi:ABC-2 type transport system permease protein